MSATTTVKKSRTAPNDARCSSLEGELRSLRAAAARAGNELADAQAELSELDDLTPRDMLRRIKELEELVKEKDGAIQRRDGELAEEIKALSELLYDFIAPVRVLLRAIDCGDMPLDRRKYKLPLSDLRRALLEVEASAPPWTLRWA